MTVTESPTFQNPCLPDGAFVIFSFDPKAYAKRLEDETALQNARKIQRKKYLGLIEGLGPLDLPEMRLNLDILVAGHALPQEGEDDMYCTNPSRCIPIGPGTSHPDQRAPLLPSTALPWPQGCYLHTLQLVNAFVSRIHHADAAKATVLTREELRRVIHHATVDQYESAPSRCQKHVHHDRTSEEASERASEGSTGSYYTSDDDEGSRSSSVDDPFETPMKVYIEIWEDLGTATTLGEPKNVGADINEIVAIGKEWEKRKNYEHHAKAPLTSQWAEGVAQSGDDDPNSALVEDAQPAAHDDELAPEDAIDERIERARRDDRGAQEALLEPPHEKSGIISTTDAPGSPAASSALGAASTNKTAGDDGSVYRRGPLKFATAKARHLKEWLRQTLRI
ncbi:hypothetical protein AURDEDRAFT_174302 [Auricularia subglabra TFB-10046 SS5]|nr:hypothetical protein AURDEDRAFT_174302 [Auricularia subglabra TFB-10046 SS5]